MATDGDEGIRKIGWVEVRTDLSMLVADLYRANSYLPWELPDDIHRFVNPMFQPMRRPLFSVMPVT